MTVAINGSSFQVQIGASLQNALAPYPTQTFADKGVVFELFF
jgi:hypothetical protein